MAKILKIEIAPDGKVEAFYTFTDSEGLPQNAGMQTTVDGRALVAAALAEVEASLGALAPAAPSPAALVAAMTRLGDARAAEMTKRAELAEADRQLAAKQAAIADADAQLAVKQAAIAEATAAATTTVTKE